MTETHRMTEKLCELIALAIETADGTVIRQATHGKTLNAATSGGLLNEEGDGYRVTGYGLRSLASASKATDEQKAAAKAELERRKGGASVVGDKPDFEADDGTVISGWRREGGAWVKVDGTPEDTVPEDMRREFDRIDANNRDIALAGVARSVATENKEPETGEKVDAKARPAAVAALLSFADKKKSRRQREKDKAAGADVTDREVEPVAKEIEEAKAEHAVSVANSDDADGELVLSDAAKRSHEESRLRALEAAFLVLGGAKLTEVRALLYGRQGDVTDREAELVEAQKSIAHLTGQLADAERHHAAVKSTLSTKIVNAEARAEKAEKQRKAASDALKSAWRETKPTTKTEIMGAIKSILPAHSDRGVILDAIESILD